MSIPKLKKIKTTKNYHGIPLEDDYSWVDQPNILEVLKDPKKLNTEVKDYIEANNKITEDYFEDVKELQKNLFNEIKGKIKLDDTGLKYKDKRFYYWHKTEAKGNYGKNAYEEVEYNIKRIKKKILSNKTSAKLNASYVISEWNLNDTENAAEFGKKLNIDSIFFRPDMELFNERNNNLKKILSKNNDIISKAKKHETSNFKVFIEYDREKDSLEVDDPNLKCFYSNHSIYIAANGDVYPCCYTRMWKKYAIKNINEISFNDFWKSNLAEENYKKLNVNQCPTCPYIEVNKALEGLYLTKKIYYPKNEKKIKNSEDPFI